MVENVLYCRRGSDSSAVSKAGSVFGRADETASGGSRERGVGIGRHDQGFAGDGRLAPGYRGGRQGVGLAACQAKRKDSTKGGGRKRTADTDSTLKRDLERLVDPVSRGDPESPLRWTCKSVRQLATALKGMGHRTSHRSTSSATPSIRSNHECQKCNSYFVTGPNVGCNVEQSLDSARISRGSRPLAKFNGCNEVVFSTIS